jgi:hypothetical protein
VGLVISPLREVCDFVLLDCKFQHCVNLSPTLLVHMGEGISGPDLRKPEHAGSVASALHIHHCCIMCLCSSGGLGLRVQTALSDAVRLGYSEVAGAFLSGLGIQAVGDGGECVVYSSCWNGGGKADFRGAISNASG